MRVEPPRSRAEESYVTEIGTPDPLEPEIEVIPLFDPVPGPIETPEPTRAPLREREPAPA
jgi:hypothetical protein